MIWTRDQQQPSLAFGLLKLAMIESRLKSSVSFASDATTTQAAATSSNSKRKHSPLSNVALTEKPIDDGSCSQQWKDKLKKFGLHAKSVLGGLLKKYWFLLGLAIAIVLATQFPNVARKNGYIHAEWTIKWGAVIVIFLISGMSLRTQTLAKTVIRIRLHILIQAINLVVIPFFVFGLVLLLLSVHVHLNSLLLIGVVIAASTPTTVSSNVVMTKNAKGNEATALMNAALGNVLGIFVSPALVSTFQGPLLDATPEEENRHSVDGQVDFGAVLEQLGLTVLLPLVVGQIIQWTFPETVAKIKVKCRLSDISSVALLLMVWSVFSDAVYSGSFGAVGATDIVAIAILNAGLYILFSAFSLFMARIPLPRRIHSSTRWLDRVRYSREDTVAVMYCAATKTVAMGVPLINVLYQSGDPGTVGVLSTPLLLYHVEQLILGNIEVEILKKWVLKGQAAAAASNGSDNEDDIPPSRDEEDRIASSATRIHNTSDCSSVPKIDTNVSSAIRGLDSSATAVCASHLTLSGRTTPVRESYYYDNRGLETPTTPVTIAVSPPDTPVKPTQDH